MKSWGERRLRAGWGLALAIGLCTPAMAAPDPDRLVNRGMQQLQAGDTPGALATLNEAIALAPDLAPAFLNRGVVHARMGDMVRAIADYDKAIALRPENHLAFINRGAAYAALGQYERAIEDYQAGLRIAPLSSLTLINLASAYRALGRYPEALEAVDHSYRLKTEPRAQVVRGNILLEMQDYAEAEGAYTKAILTFRRYTEAYVGRAYARIKLGAYDGAMQDAGRAIELDPANPGHLNERCWLRAMAGRDIPAALDDCNKALATEPDNVGFLHSRAYAQLQGGALPAAEADIERAATLKPQDADVLFLRGLIRLRLGREADARADVDRALKLRPVVHRDYTGLNLPEWAKAPG